MIKITGFTQIQKELADQLWRMDSEAQARQFVDSLPKDLRREAWVVISMIIAQQLDGVDQVSPELTRYLQGL
jgi:hypothetical protein